MAKLKTTENTADANTTTDAPTTNADVGKVKATRIPGVPTGVRTGVPIPTNTRKRGQKTKYDFDALEIGASFGIKDKTAKNMQSIVSTANKRFLQVKRDETGAIVYKTKKISAGEGQPMTEVPTNDPETVATRHFVIYDVDPATDPDGASVRIWRDK